MTEPNPGYQITPPSEPEVKLTYAWQKKLIDKANRLRATRMTCALMVVFHADGCVTFFPAEAGGRVCP